jgi:kynurenine formamidase
MFTEPFQIIDLGCYLDQAAYPPWGFKANFVEHDQGARAMANFFNLREFGDEEVEATDFPESLGLSWTHVRMSDHTGNHIDAPYHFGPLVEGKPAKRIDEVPLEWCQGPGVRLDFRTHQGRDITRADLIAELERIDYTLVPGCIPLLWTGADEHIDDDDLYWKIQAGISLDGLHYLLDHGVKLIGIDAYAMDVSYATMQQQLQNDTPDFFPAHFVGREREHMHLEKLVGLGQLPRPHGFWFTAFPIKLRGGSAGWVRPVAMVPASHF